ncbi:hypothetical protein LSH36_122g03027 [Paralvinella palmiformis]|uniref:CUB domain-containing protein n=1 Tax=Paralvinella palmiformis TaxID=53620 RepID=A0AAD9N8R7_9ANNE|nr:hypothetical protein LSH36_122g03027 [Paralvinella palmiformis]
MGELSKADCVPGFSIITSSALYGRMALGRCLSAEFGFLGCTNDVLFLADRWCSGRRSCQFFIPNKDLDQANGRCSPDLRAYMQMSYYCVPVIHAGGHHCKQGEQVTLTQPEGYLSYQVTEETGCGSGGSPWRIEASAGQTINITLIDFFALERGTMMSSERSTHTYIHIIESDLGINKTVCGTTERTRLVHSSTSNVVEIHVLQNTDPDIQDATYRYMIYYTFTGCADIEPPEGAWYRRDGYKAVIGCHGSDVSWEIICSGYTWQGEIGNCSGIGNCNTATSEWMGEFKVAIASAVTCLTLVLVTVGVSILVCYLKRRRRQLPQMPHPYQEGLTRCGYATNPHYQPVTFDYIPDTASNASGGERTKCAPPTGMSAAMAKSFMPIWRTPLPRNPNRTRENSHVTTTREAPTNQNGARWKRGGGGDECACAKSANHHHATEQSDNRRNERSQKASMICSDVKYLTDDNLRQSRHKNYCSLTKV